MPEWMLILVQAVVIGGIIIFVVVMWWRKNFSFKNSEHKSSSSTSSNSKGAENVFVIHDKMGNERILTYTESWGKQLRTDYNEKSPYYQKEYNYYVDDKGEYWRSYDGGKTFLKENYSHEIV